LTSTDDHQNRGPLIFAINFSNPCAFGWQDVDNNCGQENPENPELIGGIPNYMQNYTGLTVYIPPEFDLSAALSNVGLIQSTWGATSDDVIITQADKWDPWAPGWWVVYVEGDIQFWPQHDYREWYYLRINDVVAPTIAGKYFFKVFLGDQYFNIFNWAGMPRSLQVNGYQCEPAVGQCVNGPDPNSPFVIPTGATNATVPVENWPVLLVKGEVDPGIITGTIRYGTFNQTLYQQPIDLAGKVRAVGTAIDPYKSDHPSTGRSVEAWGYFNQSARGHYEVEGVAPGVYDIYASAAGYPEQLIASGVTILPGQSFHLDGYVNPGAVVHGQFFSKHLFGEEPWPFDPRPIFVEIYNSNDYSDQSVVTYSPLNLTHAPYSGYDWDPLAANTVDQFGTTGDPTLPSPKPVAFPWDANAGGTPAAWGGAYYSQDFPSPAINPGADPFNAHDDITCGDVVDPCGKHNGVGPAQYWWVDGQGAFTNGGGANSFIFRFGVKGVYGAPTEMDGHVPQTFATWVNGLTPGRYWVRGSLNGYTQTLQDGVTLDEFYFDVAKDEWAGDIFTPIDLRVSSTIVKTVHFHDQPGTLQECPINGCAGNDAQGLSRGSRFLIAEVRDSEGNLAGMNFTRVECTSDSCPSSATIQVNGFGMMGPDTTGIKYSYFRYQGFRDYGLPSGTYKVYTYMRGYIQQTYESVSITLSGSPATISNHMYRGARLNITAYSIDWEHPRVQRPWEFPGARIRIYVFNSVGASLYGPYAAATVGAVGAGYRGDDPRRIGTCFDLDLSGDIDPTTECGPFVEANDAANTAATGIGPTTHKVNEYDGYISADDRGPDENPWFVVHFGGNWLPWWDSAGFLYATSWYRFGASDNFAARNALESDTYTVFGFTYGYVQHKEFSNYAPKGGFGDIKLNLLQGVNITLNIPLKKEGIYTPSEFNMTMRVRVFDDSGNLVATAQSKTPDNGCYSPEALNPLFGGGFLCNDNTEFGIGRFSGSVRSPVGSIFQSYYVDPFAQSPSADNGLSSIDASSKTADTFLWHGTWNVGEQGEPITGWQAFDSDPNHDGAPDFGVFQINQDGWGYFGWTSWIPAGTDQVRVFIAGMYDVFGDPLDGLNAGVLHTKAWDGSMGERVDSMVYGIDGFSSTIPNAYSGSWSVEVDTWNEYPKPTLVDINSDELAPPVTNWYPPAEGLLEGDSFHTIPGHPAGPFGYTGDTLAANGLGPYAQRSVWTIPNTHLGSETSAVFELDKRGFISGNIFGFTWSDELRTQSWITVQAASAAGNMSFTQWSWDAHYDMYLDPGAYSFTIAAWTPSGSEGYNTVSSSINISPGQSTAGVTFQLERSNIPVPEFTGLAVVAFSALAASVYLLRRKRQ
jgi:hypothetical protein